MARAGQQHKKRTPKAASDVRERLLAAGEATLREQGFFDASARVIAERAGVAVGSIHYHFDSVEDLLLQSFDRANSQRLDDYRAVAEESDDLAALAANVGAFFAEDRDSGRFRMLTEMMAGAAGGGTLAEQVAERTEPWVEVANQAVRRFVGDQPFGVLESRDVAIGVVALFVGLELLDELDAERFDTAGFLERSSSLVALAASLLGGPNDGRR